MIDEYQTTSHAPEALMRLTESYLALGVPEEAQRAAAVLGANYPGTHWYRRAYELMQAASSRAARQPPAPAPRPRCAGDAPSAAEAGAAARLMLTGELPHPHADRSSRSATSC